MPDLGMDYVVERLRVLCMSPRKSPKKYTPNSSPGQSPWKKRLLEGDIPSKNRQNHKDYAQKHEQKQKHSLWKSRQTERYSSYNEQQMTEQLMCIQQDKTGVYSFKYQFTEERDLCKRKQSDRYSSCSCKQTTRQSSSKHQETSNNSPCKCKQSDRYSSCSCKQTTGQSSSKHQETSNNSPCKCKQSDRYSSCSCKHQETSNNSPSKCKQRTVQSTSGVQKKSEFSSSTGHKKNKHFLCTNQEHIVHSPYKSQPTVQCSPCKGLTTALRSEAWTSVDCHQYSPFSSPKNTVKKRDLYDKSPIKICKPHQFPLRANDSSNRSPQKSCESYHQPHKMSPENQNPLTLKCLHNQSLQHSCFSSKISSFELPEFVKYSHSPLTFRRTSVKNKQRSLKESSDDQCLSVLYSAYSWKDNSIERINKVSLTRPLNLYYHDDDITMWYNQSEFVTVSLHWHNNFRSFHGSPPLLLSPQLCVRAQDWANHLAHTNTIYHRNDMGIGQNLFCKCLGISDADPTGDQVAKYWYQEIKMYDFYQKPSLLHVKSNHFTQMVWRNTQEFGIGKTRTRFGKIVVVANYRPAGNVIGHFHQNVFPPVKKIEESSNKINIPKAL
ncbi:uncharacterized protein LOC106466686 [Limulus polyphemus]|uniref:Uncharacterized protein LOC106466686 n=1 Tax=Limulus polyphemus TaxID=6850 RepID=A0ABM1T3K7_LIMPO|nr:uncharacterized protein LOC106466686 [Limulus polyphemus]